MTAVYTNDFEAAADGALAAFGNVNGGAVVKTGTNGPANPVRGSKAFFMASDGDGGSYTAGASMTDQAVRQAQKYVTTSSVQNVLRGTGNSVGYRGWYEKDPSGSNIRARVGLYNPALITSTDGAYDIVVSAGQVIHQETKAVGTTIEHRVWVGSAARPSSPTVSLTNSALTSGSPGVRKVGSFEWTACDDLVITDATGGENYFYPSGPTISVQPANQTVTAPATATFSITASASGGGTLSYQWKRNGTNVGPNSNSLTTGSTTVTGGTWNNGDSITCVVTETGGTNDGSITSSAATLTVNGGGGGGRLFRQAIGGQLTGVGTSGPFFTNPLN